LSKIEIVIVPYSSLYIISLSLNPDFPLGAPQVRPMENLGLSVEGI